MDQEIVVRYEDSEKRDYVLIAFDAALRRARDANPELTIVVQADIAPGWLFGYLTNIGGLLEAGERIRWLKENQFKEEW